MARQAIMAAPMSPTALPRDSSSFASFTGTDLLTTSLDTVA